MNVPGTASRLIGRRAVASLALGGLSVLALSGCVVVNPTAGADRDGMDGMHDDTSQGSDDFSPGDVMFAQMMIPHHEQAIEMSELILAKDGVDAAVVDLAEEIKAAQGPEIEQMESWLDDWGMPGMEGDMGNMGMDGMLTDAEMDELEDADGEAGTELFLEGMIEHHEGAIAMAEQHQKNGENQEALELSRSIIRSQSAEIEVMQELLGG
jgi:uncharacterized protein (DUF305 family)